MEGEKIDHVNGGTDSEKNLDPTIGNTTGRVAQTAGDVVGEFPLQNQSDGQGFAPTIN